MHPSFAHRIVQVSCPALCRANHCLVRRLGVGVHTPPQGPSLRSGFFCPGPSSLIGPIRPTRRHITISPTLRLIRHAFAVRERLGDPRVVPGFHCSFLPGMPSPMSPGRSESFSVQFTDSNIGLRRDLSGSALPFILPSVSSRARISRLTGSHSLRPVWSLAPLTDLTRISPSHRGFYIQAFPESVTLLAAGYNFDIYWTSFVGGTLTHWNDSYPRCTRSLSGDIIERIRQDQEEGGQVR